MASAIPAIMDDLMRSGELDKIDVATIAAISPAALSRWVIGNSSPDLETELLISNLHRVVEQLAELYDPADVRTWLYAKHSLLDGERAIDLIHDGHADEVIAIIEGLSDGAYA